MITFVVKGFPIAKPRMTQRDKWYPRAVTKKYWEWKELIGYSALPVRPREVITGPVKMVLTFYMPKSRISKQIHKEHIKKPDLSNLIKAVEDSLNGVIYRDDSQIISLEAHKKFAEPGEEKVVIGISHGKELA